MGHRELNGLRTPIVIRQAEDADIPKIRGVTIEAFAGSELGHHGEADLIERICEACPDSLSLVAEMDESIVGHILFSPARIVSESNPWAGMGLAPMSVSPKFQRRGIGTRLAEAGLECLRDRGVGWVVVLGHPAFYERLGFEPASRFGISCEFLGVPDEVFRIKWLSDDRADRPQGIVKYLPEFYDMPD